MTTSVSLRPSSSGVSLPSFLDANAPRYLLAQYTSDALRQESRNIGVIIWTTEGLAARFLAERHDAPNGVDSRRIPRFISLGNANAYIQWVKHWRYQLSQDAVIPLDGGSAVPKNIPEFLQVLQGYCGENYSLIEGGYFLDEVTASNINDAADELFDALVTSDTEQDVEPEVTQQRLDRTVKRLLDRSGLSKHPNLVPLYPVRCHLTPAKGTNKDEPPILEDIKFSYVFGNGTPQYIYQNVPLPKKPAELNRSVRATAWMFEQVLNSDILDPNHCRALVYYSEQRGADTETRKAVRTLGSLVEVVNVHERSNDVLREFSQLAELPEITHDENLFSD